jgi:hypothetical protein
MYEPGSNPHNISNFRTEIRRQPYFEANNVY